MPRSRASSPSVGTDKDEVHEDLSPPSTPTRLCPSVKHHPGLTIPSPERTQTNIDGTPRKKVKHVQPRIGGNFQAQIKAFVPKPKNDSQELNVSVSSASLPPGSSASTGTGAKKKRAGRPPKGGRPKQPDTSELLTYDPTIRPKRGGLCIHRPSSPTPSHDQFLTFSRNLQLQTPRDATHNIERADFLWENALQKNTFRIMEKVSKEKKRGKKRKLVEKGDSSISDVSVATGNSANFSMDTDNKQDCMEVDATSEDGDANGNGTCEIALGTEDDYRMLEYLQLKGSGQVARAQFLSLVDLCRGTAVRTRRRARKAKKKEDMDLDSVPLSALIAPLSYTWRGRYESMNSTIIGDHRKNAGQSAYPYFDKGDSSTSGLYPWTRNWDTNTGDLDAANERKRPLNADWDTFEKIERNPDLIACWTSILERGQMVVTNCENGLKPNFADLFILLKKAHSIPNPEEVFGKRDTMPKRIAQCLNTIIDLVDNGRDVLAHMTDAMYDDSDEGLELQGLRKTIDAKSGILKVQLDELSIAQDILSEALDWESRLTDKSRSDDEESSSSEDLHLPNQSLSSAENQARQGRQLALRTNSLVSLEDRIHKAYDLRNRIRDWNKNNENDKDGVKNIGTMIKEANKIDLNFPELSFLSKVHRNAEEWLDRASVALRSKISLNELESLVKTGVKMPLGLTGTLEKLQSRYKQACDWIAALKEEVPCPLESMSASGCDLDAGNRAEWLLRIRNTLNSGSEDCVSTLEDLSSQGSRQHVEIDFLHLLQTAIDARNWSQKAKRWVPSSGDEFKRGKIEDLQDHLDAAETIMDRLEQLTGGKAEWTLEFEEELQNIVDKADEWFETYRPFLTGDNRRANSRNHCAYAELKKIVDEAEQIPSNLGTPFSKINRIHNDAAEWMKTHQDLLQRCGIGTLANNISEKICSVSIDEVNGATESASKDLAVDLDEAKELENMAALSQDWFDQALKVAPKRNKRVVSKKPCDGKCTMEKVVSLIETSSTIPMDTSEDVERLQLLLSEVQSWRLQAQQEIEQISDTANILVGERVRFYGKSNEFLKDQVESMEVETEADISTHVDEKKDPTESYDKPPISKRKGIDIYKMVDSLAKSSDSVHITTFEEEFAKQLSNTLKWCKKASEIIDSHEDIFTDKRWKRDLDALIKESSSMELSYENFTVPLPDDGGEEKDTFDMLKKSIGILISDDLSRLEMLLAKRDNYYVWCKKANDAYIESDKRVPLEELTALSEECKIYPPNAETVKRVSKDARIATEWVADAKHMLESGNPLSIDEVKTKLNKVARVKFTSSEYVTLKKSYQNAKSWIVKVSKCGLNDNSAHIHELRDLLREHEEMVITIPEEEEKLKQALCGYCICRRPYEGFMIGCDECEEWYHGQCIGITQVQGDKMEKYVCVRCCVNRVYKLSSCKVAAIVRKWCDKKDLSKSRSQDNQKHQRKIREKKREMEKWRNDCQTSIKHLQAAKQRKRDRENAIEAAKWQAAAAEDELTLGVPIIPLIALGGDLSRLEEDEANAEANITKATTALEHANRRMTVLAKLSNDRKAIQHKEDMLMNSFRYWVAMIRCNVLAPDTLEMAEKSRPKPGLNCTKPSQLLSETMTHALDITSELGIISFPDIAVVRDAFQCMGWANLAFELLMKKPAIDELRCLRDLSNFVSLPEVKSVNMIKSMITRTSVWRAKAKKALAPVPNETKPFDMEMLKELGLGVTAIPVATPEEVILGNVLADEGARHCICGGPRDEVSMNCCSSCSKWYHPVCINTVLTPEGAEWECQSCKDGAIPTGVKSKATEKAVWPFIGSSRDDISPHAPLPHKMWPPFGLSNSPEAHNNLGIALSFRLEHMVKPTPRSPEDIEESVKKMMSGRAKASSLEVPTSSSAPSTPQADEAPDASPFSNQGISRPETKQSLPTTPSFLASHFPSFGSGGAIPIAGSNAPIMHQANGTLANPASLDVIHSTEIKYPSLKPVVDQPDIPPEPPQIVEGLPNGIVEDALFVARSVAQAIPLVQTANHSSEPISNVTTEEAKPFPQIWLPQDEDKQVAAMSVVSNGVSKPISFAVDLKPENWDSEDNVIADPGAPDINGSTSIVHGEKTLNVGTVIAQTPQEPAYSEKLTNIHGLVDVTMTSAEKDQDSATILENIPMPKSAQDPNPSMLS